MTVLAYLRFVLGPDADRDGFVEDLAAMSALAEDQPGFRWSEIGRDPWDDRTYIVVSEWDEVDGIRAYEHHPEHEAIMSRWDPHYAEEFVHRRFVPWVRPEPKEEERT